HHHAEGREAQEREHECDQNEREQEVDEPPPRVADGVSKPEPGADVSAAREGRRRRHRNRVRAEVGLHDLLQHDCQPEGDEDLVGVRATVEMADQAALERHAEQPHHRDREQDRQWNRVVDQALAEVAEPDLQVRDLLVRIEERDALVLHLPGDVEQLVQRDRAEGADHEQGAMREVHDAERAEDQREPEGDQRVGAALVEAVEQLQEDRFHRRSGRRACAGAQALVVEGPPDRRRGRAGGLAPRFRSAQLVTSYGPSSPPPMFSGYSTCARGTTCTISSMSHLPLGFSLPFTTSTSLKHWWSPLRYSVAPMPSPSNLKPSSALITSGGWKVPAVSTALAYSICCA